MAEKELRLSVVIPSLNSGQYLGAAIDSVLSERIPGVECVVVDGCSTDSTPMVLQQKKELYGGSLATFVGEDTGPQQAANRGWDLAKGRVVMLIGADDEVEPGALQHAIDWFDQNPDKGVLYGECQIVSETGEHLGRYAVKDFSMQTFLNTGSTVQMPSCFYRREVIENVGGMQEGDVYADLDWFARVALRYEFHRSEKAFSKFRFHQGGLTGSTTEFGVPRAMYQLNRKYGGSLFSPVARRYFALRLSRITGIGWLLKQRLRKWDWRLVPGRKPIAIFGAALSGGICLKEFRSEGNAVEFFIDNHPPRGGEYMGLEVKQPQELFSYNNIAELSIVIATGGFPFAMKRQLRRLGFKGDVYWFKPSL